MLFGDYKPGINLLHFFRESAVMPPFCTHFTDFRVKQQKQSRCIGSWPSVPLGKSTYSRYSKLHYGCFLLVLLSTSVSLLASTTRSLYYADVYYSHAQNKHVVFWHSLPTGFAWLVLLDSRSQGQPWEYKGNPPIYHHSKN